MKTSYGLNFTRCTLWELPDDDESDTLHAFVDVLGNAEKEASTGDVDSETQPLLQASSYDDTAALPPVI